MVSLRQTRMQLAYGGYLKAWSTRKATGSCDKALIVVITPAGGQRDIIGVHVHLNAHVRVIHLDLDDIVILFDKGPFRWVFGARKDGNVVPIVASISTTHTPFAFNYFFLPKITFKGYNNIEEEV
jgi:hypothetical protein